MSAKTLNDQMSAINALVALAEWFGHLPVARLEITTVVGPLGAFDGIEVSLHRRLGDFEQWRQALGISPSEIKLKDLTTCMALKGYAVFEGVVVELTGYGLPLPTLQAVAA
ncbi:hypothetical protein [Streptomyces mesophilus]|uniref:hypothetical protein n=1 Tax=Streptomyces mesophilus TaxID=1775132 RepID=UPI00331EC541